MMFKTPPSDAVLRVRMLGALLAPLLMMLTGGGCGYRFSGASARALPPDIRTIAVVAFDNQTLGFKIEQMLTAAVVHELLARTPYRVQSSPEDGDATLHGTVTGLYSSPVIFDPTISRTTEVLLTVSLRLLLVSNRTGETLFEASDWVYREPYEVSRDPAAYLGENQPALERLSRQVAASLVSSLMEGMQ